MTLTIYLLFALAAVLALWGLYRQMGWHVRQADFDSRTSHDSAGDPLPEGGGIFRLEAISNGKKRRAVARFIAANGSIPTPRQIRALK